jgi:predicted MFS family arabinose efflux permease
MNFLRNTFAVLIGLVIAGLIITLGIRIFPQWITFEAFAPFEHWQRFLESMKDDNTFFGFLLFISGLGTTVGGVVTAMIVKYAKVAYAILIGFIMLFIAMLDVIVFPYHPTFYKISIFLTFFPFSWIGGKIVSIIYERKKKRRIAEKMNQNK